MHCSFRLPRARLAQLPLPSLGMPRSPAAQGHKAAGIRLSVFFSRPWSGAMLDTHREENTSEIPREAGLETWGAGSPFRGTSCPVIVLAPAGAGAPACGPSAAKPASCGRASAARGERAGLAGLVANVRGAGGTIPGSGGRVLPSGTPALSVPGWLRAPPPRKPGCRPPGAWPGGGWTRTSPEARRTRRTGLLGPWRPMRWVVTCGNTERTSQGKSLIGDSVASAAGGRFEFDQPSDDRTGANLA